MSGIPRVPYRRLGSVTGTDVREEGMRKLGVVFAAVLCITGMLGAVPAFATPPAGMHCDGYSDASLVKLNGAGTYDLGGGVTAVVSGSTVTFSGTDSVEFCVKAATSNSGVISGETSFTVNWLNGGGQVPAISYVLIYRLCEGSTCNEPS